jgi:hypothetical protein
MSKFSKGDRVKITATQEVGTIADVYPEMRHDDLFAEYGVLIDIDAKAVTEGPNGEKLDGLTLHSGTAVFCEEEDLELIQ